LLIWENFKNFFLNSRKFSEILEKFC